MKKILLSLMTLVLVLGLVGAGAFAWFSDTETSPKNQVTAGTVVITLGGDIGGGFIVENMAPGDTVKKTLTVTNTGTLPIWFSSYVSTYTETKVDFIDQFDLVVKVTAGSGYYANQHNMGGLQAWSGSLSAAFVPGSTLDVAYPPLPPGATAKYDLFFTLDPLTNNDFQGATLNAWMGVDAVQSDNIGWTAAKAFLS